MRRLLRLLLLPPIAAAFLGFGSIHQERWTSESGETTQIVEVGAPSPWLTFQQISTHDGEGGFFEAIVDSARAAARDATANSEEGGTAELTYRRNTRWSWDFLSWSMLAGAIFLGLSLMYARLGRPAKR